MLDGILWYIICMNFKLCSVVQKREKGKQFCDSLPANTSSKSACYVS
jgi:hypothetical protein